MHDPGVEFLDPGADSRAPAGDSCAPFEEYLGPIDDGHDPGGEYPDSEGRSCAPIRDPCASFGRGRTASRHDTAAQKAAEKFLARCGFREPLGLGNLKFQLASHRDEPIVIAGDLDPLAVRAQKDRGCQMERIQGPNRRRKRLKSPGEHGRNHLKERDSIQKLTNRLGMRGRQPARVDSGPDFEFEKPTGEQIFLPEGGWRAPVFR